MKTVSDLLLSPIGILARSESQLISNVSFSTDGENFFKKIMIFIFKSFNPIEERILNVKMDHSFKLFLF
jgi:hypothetical protein